MVQVLLFEDFCTKYQSLQKKLLVRVQQHAGCVLFLRGGSGGMLPQKKMKIRSSEVHFGALLHEIKVEKNLFLLLICLYYWRKR